MNLKLYIVMDYQKHYDNLCERAKNRILETYVESHHIVPRCMGGDDSSNNIVNLTAEEHYIAHQLLVKMYPNHEGLVWAALQMTGQSNGKRHNNKLYGWLRRRYQRIAKQRLGKKNGSYGRKWYHEPNTLNNIKCLPEEVPEGYIKGRKTKPYPKCPICDKEVRKRHMKYCDDHGNDYHLHERGYDKSSWDKVESLYRKYYNIYINNNTFVEFCKITGYNKSHSTLCCMFKKYLPEYKTKNKLKR